MIHKSLTMLVLMIGVAKNQQNAVLARRQCASEASQATKASMP